METCMTVKSDELVTIIPEQTIVVGTFLTQLKLLLGIPEPVIITFSIFIDIFIYIILYIYFIYFLLLIYL